MKILTTVGLGSNVTGSYKKESALKSMWKKLGSAKLSASSAQVPECLYALSTQMPECPSALSAGVPFECSPSALRARSKCPSAFRVP